MKRVLLDTGPLVAIFHAGDHNIRAGKFIPELFGEHADQRGITLIFTDIAVNDENFHG